MNSYLISLDQRIRAETDPSLKRALVLFRRRLVEGMLTTSDR